MLRVVIDCGIGFMNRNGKKTTYGPANYLVGLPVHLIIITHAHADHSGAIPRLFAEHPEAEVIASPETLAFSEIMFRDTLRQQGREHKSGTLDYASMIFDSEDVDRLVHSNKVHMLHSGEWYETTYPKSGTWSIGLTSAGHIQGAMMVFIRPPKDTWAPIMATGDISSQDKHTVRGVMLPDENFLGDFLLQKNIIMITEATNGDRVRPMMMEQAIQIYISRLREVQAHEGFDMTATFSLDRCAQTALIQNDHGIWPHVDSPLAQQFMRQEIPDIERRLATGEIVFFGKGPDGHAHREAFHRGTCSCREKFKRNYFTLICSSATLDQGMSPWHAKHILPNRNNSVSMLGYVFPDTVAKQILEMTRGRTITLSVDQGKVSVNVICDVNHYSGWSGHDYQDDITRRTLLVNPAHLVVHHAEGRGYTGVRDSLVKSGVLDTSRIHHAKHTTEIVLR